MCGLCAFARCGMAYFDTMKVPRVLTWCIRSKRRMSVSATGVRDIALALLTTMSRPPKVSTVRSIAAFTCASSRTSTTSGKRLAAGLGDLLGRGEDGARQLGVRRLGLGGDGDVGAVARGAQRDRKSDAARGAGDEERPALERHVCSSSIRRRMSRWPRARPSGQRRIRIVHAVGALEHDALEPARGDRDVLREEARDARCAHPRPRRRSSVSRRAPPRPAWRMPAATANSRR